MVKSVGVYEAKTHLARLLDEVEQGETIIVTRHGKPVARLVPMDSSRRAVEETIAAIREFRKGKRLDGVTTRELIEEGRRR
ncbi:MAG: type II toxin-antitoxin system prevent-host-death family antitoxin [Dehalococcoidia bacterium]